MTTSATDELDSLAGQLVREAEQRNRDNAQDMYDRLHRIMEECGKARPDIAFIKRCAERAIGRRPA